MTMMVMMMVVMVKVVMVKVVVMMSDGEEEKESRTRNAKLQQPTKFTPHTCVPDILWSRPDNTVQH